MAGIGTKNNLLDIAKRLDPDGKIAKIVELLSQTNGIVEDIPFKEANEMTSHLTTVRTGLPTVYWRLLNAGVQPSKSTTAQIKEGIGMLEAWSVCDVKLAELSGNEKAYRLSEATAFLEAMNQEAAQTIFYGNAAVSPEEFNGLAIRYSSLSAANGQNIINAANSNSGGDNTSIYLVCWGEQTVHGIYPKGSKAGIDHKDMGTQVEQNAGGVTGAQLEVYKEKFNWNLGIALKDWRYVVRICNIDVSNLSGGNAADLTACMIKAIHRIPNLNMGKPVFYMNRTIFQYLDLQRRTAVTAGGQLDYSVVDGKAIYQFRGIPVKIVDALIELEATVA